MIIFKNIMLIPPARAIAELAQYCVNEISYCVNKTSYCGSQTIMCVNKIR